MDRRDAVIALVAPGATLAWPAPLLAQTEKQFRIATVGFSEEITKPWLGELLAGLRELDYVVGRNLVVDVRYDNGDNSKQSALLDELIARKPDVLFGLQARAVEMRKKTTTIPIVVILSLDPVAAGLAQSLRRPGTNVTGSASFGLELIGKHVELLTEIVPKMSRVVFLGAPLPLSPGLAAMEQAVRTASAAKGLTLIVARARDREGLALAFAMLEKERPEGIVVPGTITAIALRDEIIAHARRLRLPSISAVTGALWAEAGGLVFYGENVLHAWRAAATYVDKILKGANPVEIPLSKPPGSSSSST